MIALTLVFLSALDCSSGAALLSGLAQRECFGRLAQTTDREMQRQWRITSAAVAREARAHRGQNKPDVRVSLAASQRAWFRYRDDECSMMSDQFAGGTGIAMVENQCRIELNRQRTETLKRRANGKLFPKVR